MIVSFFFVLSTFNSSSFALISYWFRRNIQRSILGKADFKKERNNWKFNNFIYILNLKQLVIDLFIFLRQCIVTLKDLHFMLFSIEVNVCLNRKIIFFGTFSQVIILPLSTHTHFPQTAQYPASSRDVHCGLLFFNSPIHIHNMHTGIFCLVSNISICVGLECTALIRFSLELVARGNYALQTSVQVYPFPVYCEC